MLFYYAGAFRFAVNNWNTNLSVFPWNANHKGYTTLVGTYDGSSITLYVNGAAATPAAYTDPVNYPAGANVSVGKAGNSDNYFFKGSINETLILPIALTPLRVADLHIRMMHQLNMI